MTRESSTLKELVPSGRKPDHFVGVEVGPAIIRAGVFSESLRLIGKTKFSTKLERGPQAVIDRVAKCVHYAADECDLPMDRIQAVGVGLPGSVDAESGRVDMAPDLGWESILLADELRARLAIPSFADNVHRLGTLGIYLHEAKGSPARFAALFLGPQIGGGLIIDGEPFDFSKSPVHPQLLEAPAFNVFSTLPRAEFRHFRSRDFRTALRRGNQAAAGFLREIATRTGQIAAQLITQFAPEIIVLGGGVIDEMKEEIMRIAEATAREELGIAADSTTFLPSLLGDLAGITGAASWAARHGARTSRVLSAV